MITSLKYKLSLAFGTILILTVIVAAAGLYGTNRALSHQKDLYVFIHALDKKLQAISVKQNNYLNSGDIQFSRALSELINQTSQILNMELEKRTDETQKQQIKRLLSVLSGYEERFNNVVQTRIDMETMKSRLFHESRRLSSNASAIESAGEKAVNILKIVNHALAAEKNYIEQKARSGISMVLLKTNQIINSADKIRQEAYEPAVKLYAFRMGNVARQYQTVFKSFVSLMDKQNESLTNLRLTFEQLEWELRTYLDLVSEREKKHVSFVQNLVLIIALLAIGCGIFASLVLSKRITEPVKDLKISAQKILSGDLKAQVNITSKDEMADLGMSFNQMARKLDKSFKSLSRHQNQLEDLVKERTLEIEAEINRHKKTQRELEKEKDRALSYFDIAGSILVVINTDCKVTMINEAGRRLLGYSNDQIVGENWFDNFVPEPERIKTKHMFEQIMNGQIEYFEFFENDILTTEGERRTISWHNSLLKDENGTILASLSSGEDITDAIRMEYERQKLQEQLNQARKMEAIGTLAGGIAHDFNNILYPIIGYTEMAIDDLPKNNPMRDNLKLVYKGALRARELVKQILTFSRKKSTAIGIIEIQPIIKEALKLLRSSIPRNIEIEHKISKKASPVMGDPTQIYEIIMNLCTNAFHAMELTGGLLTVELFEKKILQTDNMGPDILPGLYNVISISDNGPGISAEIIKHIFEPYFTTKETGKGSGLGLAVTHGIVSSIGGAIRVESQLGQGTVFKVFFPVIKEDLTIGFHDNNTEKQGGDEHILLVDDEAGIVNMGVAALEGLGYTVKGMSDSQDALRYFTEHPDRFDILITDMTMPRMLGTDLIEKIREIKPGFPAILCTGFSELINKDKAQSLGIQGYLKKPVLIEELSSAIRNILDTDDSQTDFKG